MATARGLIGIVTGLSAWGRAHRLGVTLGVLAVLVMGGLYLRRLDLAEDVTVFLPDRDPTFAATYALLQEAPFTRSVVIDLEVADANDGGALTAAAGRLRAALVGPSFGPVGGGLSAAAGLDMLHWFYEHLPHYFDAETAAQVAASLETEALASRLRETRDRLATPAGIWLRTWLAQDPLAWRTLVFRRLGSVALLPEARLEDGCLIDPSGRHTLVVVETPVPLGDVPGGRALLAALDRAVAQAVGPAVRAHVVCAHRYTVANAETIRGDLRRVFAVSLLGLVTVFALCLRQLRALAVFAVPVPAVLIATAVAGLLCRSLSVITVGFGAVLLGITVDYGLHVFCILRQRHGDPAGALARLAVPLSLSCVTTVGAFAVLLTSALPLQRQLSVFAIAGLLSALVLALVWLPHWGVGRGPVLRARVLPVPARGPTVWLWVALLGLGVWGAGRVRFDGDLRRVGVDPAAIRADERVVATVWGDPRGRALVVTQAPTVETALQANEQAAARLAAVWDPAQVLGTAALLPSRATQTENLRRWHDFWAVPGRRAALERDLTNQGRALGFAAGAFAPLLTGLSRAPEPFDLAEFRAVTGSLLDSLVATGPRGLSLVTLVPDGDAARRAFGPGGVDLPEATRAVSPQGFAASLRRGLARDFRRFLIGAWAMVIAVLGLSLRRVRPVLLCLTPAVTGLLVMLGVMGWVGWTVNLFNIAASVLVLGLSIDYGVFMVRRDRDDGAEQRAVIASGLTTLSGFGALALAHHPAMFSLGITVILGIVPAMLAALFVVPALQGPLETNDDGVRADARDPA